MEGKGTRTSWRKRITSKLGHPGPSKGDTIHPSSPIPKLALSSAQDKNSTLVFDDGIESDSPSPRVPSVSSNPNRSNPGSQSLAKVDSNALATCKQNTFWASGYVKKKTEKPDLILAYEALIADEASGDRKPVPGPGSVVAGLLTGGSHAIQIQPGEYGTGEYFIPDREQMNTFIERQMLAIQEITWKVPFSGQSVDVQQSIRSIVRGVLYAKDVIQSIASLEPHASIAWAGVCLVLPLLCSPEEQKDSLINGLELVTSTMCRLTVSERLYQEDFRSCQSNAMPSDVSQLMARFELESVDLLADVIEYQARVACQTCRGTLSKYVRDVAKADDWSGLSKRISSADASCAKLLSTLDKEKYKQNHIVLSTTLNNLEHSVAELTDIQRLTLKEVQEGFQKLNQGMTELQSQQILEAVWTSNYEKHKRVVPEHVEGTCKWFTNHHQYLSWKNATSDALWLAADPGCGKSVLAKFLVDGDLCANSERTTCYFFFKEGITEQQGLERALCALLHQLFTQRQETIHHALNSFRKMKKAFTGSVDELWAVLMKVVSDPSTGETILIVDALDECEIEDRRELVKRVSTLYLSTDQGSKPKVKFFMTSRPYHNINISFQQLVDRLPHVHLSADQETAAIRREIDAVVDYRVSALSRTLGLRSSTAEALASKMKAADNRTYLWLRLIFDALEKSLASSKRELSRLVESIPNTLQQAYAAILKQCINPEKARKVFQILLAAQLPLTVQQLSIATSIDLDIEDDGELEAESREVFREKVRQICGLFVNVIDDKVYFIHQTAREFLMIENLRDPINTTIDLPLHITDCHLTMALSCTRYLIQGARRPSQSFGTEFMEYASNNWDMHVALAALGSDESSFKGLYDCALGVCRQKPFWSKAQISQGVKPDLKYLSVAAEITTLSFFGIVAVLWAFSIEDGSPKGKDMFVRPRTMLQWTTSRKVDGATKKPLVNLHLWLRDDNKDSTCTTDGYTYKIFWERGYLDKVMGELDRVAWSVSGNLYALAESETMQFLELVFDDLSESTASPREYVVDIEASRSALMQVFSQHSSPKSVHIATFQQLLRHAAEDGLLRELEWKL